MNKKKLDIILTIIIAAAVAVILLVSTIFYTVDETEQVVITQFGKVIGEPITEAGLYMKLPWQSVNEFDKRILEWDGIPTQIPDLEKKNIIIDSFARWRISNPKQFLLTLHGEEREAQARLDDILEAAMRDVVTSNPIIEIIRNDNRPLRIVDVGSLVRKEVIRKTISKGRKEIQEMILANAQKSLPDVGIEIIDIRVKRINYVESVRQEIYRRMISERMRIAERYRSEGAGEAREIDGKRSRMLKKILSEAERKVLEITGKAEGEAARIYANAYNIDPEFYSFWKTLETYKNTIDKNVWLFLSTGDDYGKYLKNNRK